MVGLTQQDRDFIRHMIGAAVYAIGSQITSIHERPIPMAPEETLKEFERLAKLSPADWRYKVIEPLGIS